jgi:hypothetical protein
MVILDAGGNVVRSITVGPAGPRSQLATLDLLVLDDLG